MMMYLPFICLGIGFLIGSNIKDKKILGHFDHGATIALAFLMLAVGLGIGIDDKVLQNLPKIGFQCLIVTFLAIALSIVFCVICEKTILPLKEVDDMLRREKIELLGYDDEEKENSLFLVYLMPICIVVGLILGYFLRGTVNATMLDKIITVCLIFLYITVGVSQGANKDVLKFVKKLGFRVVYLSIAVIIGSLLGGYLAGLILGLPTKITTIAASGMSYYSLTGAYMTETFGIQLGTYGFIVNVIREFSTILALPILVKISLGSPIAVGGAGDMDTLLAPVTKAVGRRLGLVTLVTGAILTFVIPFLLPFLALVLK